MRKTEIAILSLTLMLVAAVAVVAVMKGRETNPESRVRFVGRAQELDFRVQASVAAATLPAESQADEPNSPESNTSALTAPLTAAPPGAALRDFDLGKITGLNQHLQLSQVTIEETDETINLPFEELYEYTDELPEGEYHIVQYGANGLMKIRSRHVYHGGVLHNTEILMQAVVQAPLIQIVKMGVAPPAAGNGENAIEWQSPDTINAAGGSADEELRLLLEAAQPLDSQAPAGDGAEKPPEVVQEIPVREETPAVSWFGFSTPGSVSAAENNFSIVAGLLSRNGASNYYQFNNNGDGTISVDGVTLPVSSSFVWTTTCYDGYECAKLVDFIYGTCNPTASGILAQRGIVAAAMGGLPFGTVLFVEGYGLCVVADRHGMGADFLDLSMDAGEISQGVILNTGNRNIYVISIP